MRNGNKAMEGMKNVTYGNSSYPTYEEWKHKDSGELGIRHRVLILPMRNGNYSLSIRT